MRRVAERLGITAPEATWASLVKTAAFGQMRAEANRFVSADPVYQDNAAAFFRSGISGEGRALLTSTEYARYQSRVAPLASPAFWPGCTAATGPQDGPARVFGFAADRVGGYAR